MAIAPGLVGEVELVVQPADTAAALGNSGVHVLATPRLVALLEQAAIRAVEGHLPPGAGTVGTRIDIRHLAATPVGMRAPSVPRSARSTAGASPSRSRVATRPSGSSRAPTSGSRSTKPGSSRVSRPRPVADPVSPRRAPRAAPFARGGCGRVSLSRRGRPGRGLRAWRGRARRRPPEGGRCPLRRARGTRPRPSSSARSRGGNHCGSPGGP
jgi:hypothetical protein